MHGQHAHAPHDDSTRHGHGEPFSPQEIDFFQAEDRSAAKAIVSLMLGVFSLGLMGSIAICLVIRS
ncbi:MAG TPA: hypothetical protein VL371_07275 [Gemmataceae bacterium]|jgi:hypothetical protein|nr:hypothetical protein [Gemmataceae bacterium]